MTRLILLVLGFVVGMVVCARVFPTQDGSRRTVAAAWAVRIIIGAAMAITAAAGYDAWHGAQIRISDLTPEDDNASVISDILQDLFWKVAILLGLAAVIELALHRHIEGREKSSP